MANACYDQIRIVSTKSKFRWASIDFTSSTWYINNILRVDSYSPSVLPIVIIMLFAYQKTNLYSIGSNFASRHSFRINQTSIYISII